MFRIFRVPCMSMPIRHLPVFQNWDCHVCGSCCKEYVVAITPEERAGSKPNRGKETKSLGSRRFFANRAVLVVPRYAQSSRGWELCVLERSRACRIHERFGYAAKPLPCRLFPFALVPVGDHWR